MKCSKCGGSMSLEDRNCPYCGAVNEHAAEHIRQMSEFKADYEGTKKQVYFTANKYAGVAVRAVIIAIICILIVVCILVGNNSYEIEEAFALQNGLRHADEYTAMLDVYISEKDYESIHVMERSYNLYHYDSPYEPYLAVFNMSSRYVRIYDGIMKLYLQENDYETSERLINDLSRELVEFFEFPDETYRFDENYELNRMVYNDMLAEIEALLHTYCGLSQTEVGILDIMTERQIGNLLEQGLKGGNQDA